MSEVTNDLIYEVLKDVQTRVNRLDHTLGEVKSEIQAVRTHMVGMQQDIVNIYVRLDDHGARLDRIERRLGLLEPSH